MLGSDLTRVDGEGETEKGTEIIVLRQAGKT